MAAKKKASARKYGKKASEKVRENMHELKQGKLRSSSGRKVKSRKQAIAIGLSEARRAGGKVPNKKGEKKAAKKTAKRAAKKGTKKAAKQTARRAPKKAGARKKGSRAA